MYIFICPLPKGLLKAITLKTLTCQSFILPMSSFIFQILFYFIQIESHFKTAKFTQ